MQKQVSKQSLAIVALSILLAICMALTATYAAFQTSKNVTGQITFVKPTLSIVLSNTNALSQTSTEMVETKDAQDVVTTMKFALTNDDLVFASGDTDTMTIDSDVIADLNKATYQIVVSEGNVLPVQYTIGYAWKAYTSGTGNDKVYTTNLTEAQATTVSTLLTLTTRANTANTITSSTAQTSFGFATAATAIPDSFDFELTITITAWFADAAITN